MNWSSFWIGVSVIPMAMFALVVILFATYIVAFIILDVKHQQSRPGGFSILEAFKMWRKRRKGDSDELG